MVVPCSRSPNAQKHAPSMHATEPVPTHHEIERRGREGARPERIPRHRTVGGWRNRNSSDGIRPHTRITATATR